MTKDQINASLDAMLENPKANSFLNHLIRSYIPSTNVSKVLETPKGEFKCVLTRDILISDQELSKVINSEPYQIAMKNSISENLEAKKNESFKKVVGDKQSSITGKETTTFMSNAAYEVFVEWVNNKASNGDKLIKWSLNSIKRENFNDNKVITEKNNNILATVSLGDFSDVLSKLKTKLESNNN